MIEKNFVSHNLKEFKIQEFIINEIGTAGYSHIEIQKTPLGEKVIIYTSRPGLMVGRKGENIKKLTEVLKTRFKMENPQIEIADVDNPSLNPQAVAERVVYVLERFGPKRFKATGYKALQQMMDGGATGAEIVISGKIPSSRSRTWRFYAGYLKKSGDISESFVKKCKTTAHLKSGAVGIKVSILTPDVELPDKIIEKTIKMEEVKDGNTKTKTDKGNE